MSPVLLNPFGFGAPPVPMDDFFEDNGSAFPIFGVATWPAAFYDATSDTTWIAWEAWYGGSRRIMVTTYDHTADAWGETYGISPHALINDAHGVPAICMDHEGYVHVFFGAHNSAFVYMSTAVADDPSAWRRHSDLSGSYTYPKPVLVGTAMYLFIRTGVIANQHYRLVVRKTSALSGGVGTFAADTQLVDMGSAGDGTRPYAGVAIVDGTDIHLVWTRADGLDSIRQDVYHAIYDTTDGSLRNSDGSTDTAAGSLPINLALANSDYRVVSMSTTETGTPAFCIASDGTWHIVYAEGTADDNYSLKHIDNPGDGASAWTAPETITTFDGTRTNFSDGLALVPIGSGNIELWYPDNVGDAWTHGGDCIRVIRTSGTWGSPTTILASGTYALDRMHVVQNGHADARVVFVEVAQAETDVAAYAADKKLYAHGDNGFLAKPTPEAGADPDFNRVAFLFDVEQPGSGTDPDFADVVFLFDGG